MSLVFFFLFRYAHIVRVVYYIDGFSAKVFLVTTCSFYFARLVFESKMAMYKVN